MNRVEFVIAPDEFGSGQLDGIEPVIDGRSLIDVLKRADGEIWYAGRTCVERTLEELRAILSGERDGLRIQLLGCECGIDECSGVLATMSVIDETVVWSDLRAMRSRPGAERRQPYEEVEQFVFAVPQFAQALAEPGRQQAPLREPADIESLAAGMPRDHAAWLHAMTMAFDRDFLTPYEPDSTKCVVASGLSAFAAAGAPLTDEAIRTWMHGLNFTPGAIDRYVAWRHELYPCSE